MIDILETKMLSNDVEAETVRDYLKSLLSVLWNEQDGFSGKRPFGNSGWEWEVINSVIAGGHTNDPSEAWSLIYKAIQTL